MKKSLKGILIAVIAYSIIVTFKESITNPILTSLTITEIVALIIIIAIPAKSNEQSHKDSQLKYDQFEYGKCEYGQFTNKNISNHPPKTEATVYSKKKLLTECEIKYKRAIQKAMPLGYYLFPQICLASIIKKENNNKYANELFRIADFGIFDTEYNIICIIEINDSSHYDKARIARDYKVKELCQQTNIPIITLWTGFGINEDYIRKRIAEHISDPDYLQNSYRT